MEKTLTDNDIKNGLAELAEFCKKCGNLTKENDTLNNALDLISQLQADLQFAKNINALQMEELQKTQAENEMLRNFLEIADNCIGDCSYSLTKVSNSRVEAAVNEWEESGYKEYIENKNN